MIPASSDISIPERKSRRTHKNSRDGCPNCKARRIKCTEEVPQCQNCLKKKYRCGYLDFPKDKLDYIRKKNEKALRSSEYNYLNQNSYQVNHAGHPRYAGHIVLQPHETGIDAQQNDQNFPGHIQFPVMQDPNVCYDAKNDGMNYLPHMSDGFSIHNNNYSFQNDKDIFSNVQPITHSVLQHDFFATRDDLRIAMYKQTSLQFQLRSKHNSDPMFEGNSNMHIKEEKTDSSNLSDNSGNHRTNIIYPDELSQDMSKEIFEQSRVTLGRHLKSSCGGNVGDDFIERKLNAVDDNPYQLALNKNAEFSSTQTQPYNKYNIILSTTPPAIKVGQPLAGARIEQVTIPRLKENQQLKNDFLHKFLSKYGRDFKKISTDGYRNTSPVWSDDQMNNFWKSVFNQSVLIDVYFSFFMDKAINVLLKTCNFMLSATEANLKIKKEYEEENILDDLEKDETIKSLWSSFTLHDLNILTRKSYYYYGLLIRDIRESLTEINIEFPTKISLYGAWTTFLHMDASLNTLLLMFSGTAFLMQKVFAEANDIKDLGVTMIAVSQIFNDSANLSIIPDYTFQVIRDIYTDLMTFKYFLIDNNTLAQTSDELVLREFLELEQFLRELIYKTFPRMATLNEHFKRKNQIKDPSNSMRFFSIKMLFDLVVSWFNIFPSGCLTISSSMSPVKKTLYLYYQTVGKAMMHVFPCIRSILLVDPVHVLMPKIDFNSELYEISVADVGGSLEQHQFLINQSQKLIRMIKFFNFRFVIISYFNHTTSTLDNTNGVTYIQNENSRDVETPPASVEGVTDIISFTNPKMDLEEIMIQDFSKPFKLENYPLLKNIHNRIEQPIGKKLQKIIGASIDRSIGRSSMEDQERSANNPTPLNKSTPNIKQEETIGLSPSFCNSSGSSPGSNNQSVSGSLSEHTTSSSANSLSSSTNVHHRASKRGIFQYNRGLYTGDYDPSDSIEVLVDYRSSQFVLDDKSLEKFRNRLVNFKQSRNVLSDSLLTTP